MPSKSSPKKTMDVSKPGESTPDTSARPVLVTHRPMVQDPTVKDDTKSQDKSVEDKPTMASRGSKVIKPVNDLESSPSDPEPDKPKESADSSEPEATTKTEPSSETDSSKTPDSKDSAVLEAVADQATEDKKKQNQLSDEEKAKKEALQKMVEAETYFVPVGQVSRRRNRRAGLIILGILLMLVVVYLALDAGMVDSPFELPVDLIKT